MRAMVLGASRTSRLAKLRVEQHERRDEEGVASEQQPDRPVLVAQAVSPNEYSGCVSASAARNVRRPQSALAAGGERHERHEPGQVLRREHLAEDRERGDRRGPRGDEPRVVVGPAPVGARDERARAHERAAEREHADHVRQAAAEVDRARLAGDPADVVDRRASSRRAGPTRRGSRSGGGASPASRSCSRPRRARAGTTAASSTAPRRRTATAPPLRRAHAPRRDRQRRPPGRSSSRSRRRAARRRPLAAAQQRDERERARAAPAAGRSG